MDLREETESALLANERKPENELAGRRRRGELSKSETREAGQEQKDEFSLGDIRF